MYPHCICLSVLDVFALLARNGWRTRGPPHHLPCCCCLLPEAESAGGGAGALRPAIRWAVALRPSGRPRPSASAGCGEEARRSGRVGRRANSDGRRRFEGGAPRRPAFFGAHAADSRGRSPSGARDSHGSCPWRQCRARGERSASADVSHAKREVPSTGDVQISPLPEIGKAVRRESSGVFSEPLHQTPRQRRASGPLLRGGRTAAGGVPGRPWRSAARRLRKRARAH